MFRSTYKKIVVLLCAGALMQFGACLNRGTVIATVKQQAFEFLLDNDAVFDLFADS